MQKDNKIKPIAIGNRLVGPGHPCFIVAEISANHNQSFNKAKRLIKLAKEAGADAVKLQTYTADTLTLNCDNKYFRIKEGPWKGQTLYELYKKAYTPWEWQPKLKKYADKLGIILFSTPFDKTAVDFLEQMNIPAYKIASFELVDTPLIQYAASKGKPIILSTGMASLNEIKEAVNAAKKEGNNKIILLKCTSNYPANPEEMNLSTIHEYARRFVVPAGLSDHSLYNEIAVAAVCQGACMIEKHFIEKRSEGGPDAHFSMEPEEMKAMIAAIRRVEAAFGRPGFRRTPAETKNLVFRRSLFAEKDIHKGDLFSNDNVRSIRPGFGLSPSKSRRVLGKKAARNISFGQPIILDCVAENK
jgi:pseudaminic acid synthase